MGALEEVRDLADSVARRKSLRLWDIEMGGQKGKRVVRVFVDGDDGVDLDTVTEVAQELSRGLDLRDPIEGRYLLEVSSPGLERALKTPDHFAASVGKAVSLKTKERLASNSHRIDGKLVRASGTSVSVALGEEGDQVDVPLEQIRSARTVFEWH
jgi:ribosome maturation factor RimP